MECFTCKKKGHPARFFPNNDDSSVSSKLKRSVEKQLKLMKKSFAQLQAAIEDSDADESISSDNHSHFQFFHTYKHYETILSQKGLNKVDLHQVILLDNQSTVSLFCNPQFASDYVKVDKPLHLQSNGSTVTVYRKAEIGDGDTKVWFSKKAITNILSLKMV